MSRRGQAGVAILILWIAGLGLLVRREAFRDAGEKLTAAALRVSPGAFFYEVGRADERIGFASSTIDTLPDGIGARDYVVIDLPVGGRYQRATITTDTRLTRGLRTRAFSVSIESPAGTVRARGEVDADTLLRLVIAGGDAPPDTQHHRLAGPILLPTMAPLAAILGSRPRVGREYEMLVFDPVALAPVTLGLTIRAESLFVMSDSASFDRANGRWHSARLDTVRAWLVIPDKPTSFTSWWVDDQGRLVQAEQVPGITIRRTAYELAFENWRLDGRERATAVPTATRDVLEVTAIASNVPLPRDRLRSMRVTLGGVDLDGFDLNGGRQHLEGMILTIRRQPPSGLRPTYRLPDGARERFAAELAPEPMAQSDHPEIRDLALEVTGGTDDPQLAARRLSEWIHQSLRKRVTFGIPSALQVLRTRSGDCNEHTQLFIAMARSLGIPARGVAGLAHVNGKFYYHAWPEVYLGTWVPIDPTFGQFPADAAHIRFVSGSLTRQAELLRLMGQLTIDVLAAE